MEIIYNDWLNTNDLKEFLLTQRGIEDVIMDEIENYSTKVKIKYNNETTPAIITKWINLYKEYTTSMMLSFDKKSEQDTHTLKYIVGDMCCEYCHMNLIEDLFNNDNIISVESNFNNTSFYNIEFIIKAKKDYSQKDLECFINDILTN